MFQKKYIIPTRKIDLFDIDMGIEYKQDVDKFQQRNESIVNTAYSAYTEFVCSVVGYDKYHYDNGVAGIPKRYALLR